jgi:hypothetical protein
VTARQLAPGKRLALHVLDVGPCHQAIGCGPDSGLAIVMRSRGNVGR